VSDEICDASDAEFDAYIGCPHTGKTYTEAGPLTGRPHTRCADCHSVVTAGGAS